MDVIQVTGGNPLHVFENLYFDYCCCDLTNGFSISKLFFYLFSDMDNAFRIGINTPGRRSALWKNHVASCCENDPRMDDNFP